MIFAKLVLFNSLFSSSKVKLQHPLELDDNIYQAINEFLSKLTVPKMRVCIALIADRHKMYKTRRKSIPHSHSGVFAVSMKIQASDDESSLLLSNS